MRVLDCEERVWGVGRECVEYMESEGGFLEEKWVVSFVDEELRIQVREMCGYASILRSQIAFC